MPLKDGLQKFSLDCPMVEAIFLGIRRTDPFASQMKPFEKTSQGWPNLTRINPILGNG